MTRIYINGKLFDKNDAKVSVYDHGFLYGDGVFEGIRIYGGKIFRLAEIIQNVSTGLVWSAPSVAHFMRIQSWSSSMPRATSL